MKKSICLLVCVVLVSGIAYATDVELEGDRPDFTESANVVPFGSFQLEGGYTFSGSNGLKEHALGELLLRVGVFHRLELRLGVNSINWADDNTDVVFGKDDASIGVKIKLLYASEQFNFIKPDISLIIGTSIPLGTEDFTGEKWQPEGKLCIGWSVTDWFGIGTNLNYAYTYDTSKVDWFSQFSGSLVMGFSLNENIGVYAEYIIFAPESSGGGTANYLSAGASWLVTKGIQLDGRFGIRVHGDHDYFTGVGFIFLWPSVW